MSEGPEMCSLVFPEALSAGELSVVETKGELPPAVMKVQSLNAPWPHLYDLEQLAWLSEA